MNIKEIKEEKKKLISSSNPEWQSILVLRIEVQRDFNDNHYPYLLIPKLCNRTSQENPNAKISPRYPISLLPS